MQAEAEAKRDGVGRTSMSPPPAIECYPQSMHTTTVPSGENATNVPSKAKLRTPVDRRAIGNQSACWHGIPRHQCVTCNNIEQS